MGVKKFLIIFFNINIVLTTSLLPFRFYFGQYVIGEPFDTKAQLVFHEHWFDYLNSVRGFLDAGFFYPYSSSFTLSDLFVISGPIHAIFRFFGFDLLDSLELSTLMIVILSNIGWLLLANKLIKSQFLKYVFVLIIGMSYTFIGHIYEKPNMASYGLISWFILNAVSLSKFQNQSSIRTTNSLGLVLTIPLILSLNVWYSAYFIFLFLIVTLIIFIFLLIITRKLKPLYLETIKFIKKIHKVLLTFWLALFFILILCLLLIYLPQTSSDYNKVNRDFFLSYSPTFSSFFDTTGSGGGLTSRIFDFLYQKNQVSPEMNLGINPIILILFLLTINVITRQFINHRSILSLVILSGALANIFIAFSIIKNQSDTSIFSFFWDNIYLLRTMRIPIRFNVIFTFVALIYIIYFADKLFYRQKFLGKFFTSLFIFLLLIDMLRVPKLYWEKEDLIDENLMSYSTQLNKCDSFVIDREEVAWWKDSIDGMVLSTVIKVPTVNGFSSIYPKNYPNINWIESSDLAGILKWLQTNDAVSNSCLITHGEEIIRLDQKSLFWSAQQGFTRLEVQDKYSWNWMVHPKASLLIYNFTPNFKTFNIDFKIKSAICNYGQEISISAKNKLLVPKFILENKPIQISLDLNLDAFEPLYINFETDANSCKLASDPRDLYLSINDFKLNFE